jgi:dienelactone hydrolase
MKVDIEPPPSDGKKHPVVLLVHGLFGLVKPFDKLFSDFAKDLAKKGYVAAVPHYFGDDNPRASVSPTEAVVFLKNLTDAIATVTQRPDADPARLGLAGFSLGGALSMTYTVSAPKLPLKALVDFYGFLTPEINTGVAAFPPTLIMHNKQDSEVDVSNSTDLDGLLTTAKVPHELKVYDEPSPAFKNHVFTPGGIADEDSRRRATAWFDKYL